MAIVIAAIFFSFQIFCDFSGYSDIALGSPRTMGFKLMKNFDAPYQSSSVSEFWKRWHISLSTWFRDYLYISLGGNRVSLPRWYFNLFFVFLVSGFWHGANWTYVAWGALNGTLLIIESILGVSSDRKNMLQTFLKSTITFLLICTTWIFFRAAHISQAIFILKKIKI